MLLEGGHAQMELRTELGDKFYFSEQEMDRRWRAIRYGMLLRGVDALLIYGEEMWIRSEAANLSYVTGALNRGWCVFPLDGDPVLFMGNYNKYYPFNYFLTVHPLLKDVKPADEGKGGGLSGVIQLIKDLGLERGRIGLVDGNDRAVTSMPYKRYDRLWKALPGVEFSDQTSLLTGLMFIKSKEEIAKLEVAAKIAERMMDAMVQSVRKGVRECEIFSNMLEAQINHGGDPYPFIRMGSGNVLSKTVHLCHGKTPPYAPAQRLLQQGDMVITEFHPTYGGYMVHAEKTVFLGRPPEELAQVYSVACQSLQSGLKAMQVGSPFNEVVQEARRPVTESGMGFMESGVGQHGLTSGGFPGGSVFPEVPGTKRKGNVARGFRIQPGMVFNQIADIYDPRWRPNVGVQMADTVLIEVNGPRRLCGPPLELEQVIR